MQLCDDRADLSDVLELVIVADANQYAETIEWKDEILFIYESILLLTDLKDALCVDRVDHCIVLLFIDFDRFMYTVNDSNLIRVEWICPCP